MLKKYPESTFIILGCFATAILSLYNNLFWIIRTTGEFTNTPRIIHEIMLKSLLDPLHLDWIYAPSYTLNINSHNYTNLIFQLLLLAGAILYTVSKQTETRLIRFVASVILFDNALSFIYGIFYLLFLRNVKESDIIDNIIEIGFYIADIVWVFLSYRTLKYFNTHKQLQSEVYGQDDAEQSYFIEASKWQRFANVFIDLMTTVALFSSSIYSFLFYTHRLSPFGNNTIAEKNIIFWLIICARIVYYIVFETLLGATPGKLFTETRVIEYDGNKPSSKIIAIRTMCRLIPFEAFSFFTYSKLHDKLSKTLVVKEKRTGFDGAFYLLIIPGIIALLYYAYTSYNHF